MNTNFLAVLESEGSVSNVSAEDLRSRREITDALRTFPKEVITHLRHFQPQAGCLNCCSFCSQGAIPTVWQLTEKALKNVFAALKTVAIEVASRQMTSLTESYLPENILNSGGTFTAGFKMPTFGLVGFGRTNHRPGVIYPYLDNDIASYPYLLQYLKCAKEDLGAKVRLSTVGYSRHNEQLQKMHECINRDCLDVLGAVKLSISPYTFGWSRKGERVGLTSRNEFILDWANLLSIYRPAVDFLGVGDRAASVEFRFPPLAVEAEVEERVISKRHVIHAGPYMLIGETETDFVPNFHVAKVITRERHAICFDEKPCFYMMVISTKLINYGEWEIIARNVIKNSTSLLAKLLPGCTVRNSKLYLFENEDGLYYGVDPLMIDTGFFAKQFYFASENRSVSGYIDSERYFLNSITAYKRSNGIGRRELFPGASWSDVDSVIQVLVNSAESAIDIDPAVGQYLKEHVLPIIMGYRKALEIAGYPASYFFDKCFTIDTGEICNLGKAYPEYRGLTSRRDSVVTPQHERIYGATGSLAKEGKIWVISVCSMVKTQGKTGILPPCPALLVEEQDLGRRSSVEGDSVRRWYIPLKVEDVEIFNASHHKSRYLIPGRNP